MIETANIIVVMKSGASEITESLSDLAASFQVDLRPQFAGTSDPTLKTFWSVRTPIMHAKELITRLLELPEVDGAYLKPADSIPEF